MRQLLFSGLVLLCACGGAEEHSARSGPSDIDLHAWSGGAAPASAAQPAEEPVAAIELAEGESFRGIVALAETADVDGAAHHCALYSIRVSDRGLEEGRLSIPCPSDGLASSPISELRYQVVEEARSAQLSAALRGAAARRTAPGSTSGDRVRVRLTTDRRQLEGEVPQPRWPAPYEEGRETPRGSPPADLAELWEAVMFPGRYAALP